MSNPISKENERRKAKEQSEYMREMKEKFSREIRPKKRPSNINIIKKYLERYKNSMGSIYMRISSLNYFFKEEHFGYSDHIFDITSWDLMKYFDYLTNLNNISLTTKKNKWAILSGFLYYLMEIYENEFKIIFPKFYINWYREILLLEPKAYKYKKKDREVGV